MTRRRFADQLIIQHTVRYTELSSDRFKDFWRISEFASASKRHRTNDNGSGIKGVWGKKERLPKSLEAASSK
jgi:hypothetical protein